MKSLLSCAALAGMLFATTAEAQTTPARSAAAPAAPRVAPPSNPGPVIAGVCILNGPGVIADSAAGRAANARLQTLTQQVQAELTAQQTPLTTEVNRIRALPEAQRAAPGQALQGRIQTFETLAQTRQEELRRTQAAALERIENELQTVVSQIYVQRGCGLMLDRSAITYANPAMDVSQAAIAALNTRMPTITFERVRLPAAPAAPAAR
jgi:outer membrane protein